MMELPPPYSIYNYDAEFQRTEDNDKRSYTIVAYSGPDPKKRLDTLYCLCIIGVPPWHDFISKNELMSKIRQIKFESLL